MHPSLYVYKLTVDDGGAPCVTDALCSLAICKPAIRSTAERGSIIFGIGSNAAPLDNRLIYIAVVTAKETKGRYYQLPHFSARPDCIYERTKDNRLRRRRTAIFHYDPSNTDRDIGQGPDYAKANALLSSDFRYFGEAGTTDYKRSCPNLAALVETLGQGHRLNHPEQIRDELLQLKEQVWSRYSGKMKIGNPCQPPQIYLTDEGAGCIEVCAPSGRWLNDERCAPIC